MNLPMLQVMPWIYLFLAGLCEIVWAIGLKKSDGFSRLIPTVWTIAVMLLSFALLALAMRTLPLGISYAVWTGIGVIGTVLYGICFLNEPRDVLRLVCIALILTGIAGLKILARA